VEEKSTMNQVVFTRKAADLVGLQQGSWSENEPCQVVVEHVVELPPASYARFTGNLLADSDFLREHQNAMFIDPDGVWHCLLVKAQGARDGILVNAEGATFARYSAYCPDSRPFVQEAEQRTKEGGELPMPSQERTKQDRLFFVSYEYTESGETQRCGLVCEANSIRAAAEAFWGQHPFDTFQLRSVTDGTLEAFWHAPSSQFVTVPQREGTFGKTYTPVEEALRRINAGEQHMLLSQPVERELHAIRDGIEQALLLLGSPAGYSAEELGGLLDETHKQVWKLEKMLQYARMSFVLYHGSPAILVKLACLLADDILWR
jgi:hypothetical protein